ncbi:MAG: DUF1349 domain-containing protein [Actinobacteria bacterium]|nr:DUF1349 domain-containing protein [Actinomycetota bacterium]
MTEFQVGTKVGLTSKEWSWTNEPKDWQVVGDDALAWHCLPGSDFWRLTESGVVRHNGQAFVAEVEGDFTIEGQIEADLRQQYDQAGLFALADEERWLKAGAEWEGGLLVGAVHTQGSSDWSMAPGSLPVGLRMRRRQDTVDVAVKDDGGSWQMIRQLSLPGPVSVGPYSCAPAGDGFETRLSEFLLTRG